MAIFSIAYKNTGGHEGGWNVDNGGQTYQGISRKGWPNWKGWRLIDQWIKKNGNPRRYQYFNDPAIDTLVPMFYKENYWDKIKGDEIKNQTIANFIYDFYVNSGSALLKINKGLGGENVTRGITSGTLHIINKFAATAYQKLYSIRKNHYTELAKKPDLKKYKAGWFARLATFPTSIGVSGIGALKTREVAAILDNKGLPFLTRKEVIHAGYMDRDKWVEETPITPHQIAKEYSQISKVIETIVKQFPDAKLNLSGTDHITLTYNNGKGAAKFQAHTPGVREVLYQSYITAKSKR